MRRRHRSTSRTVASASATTSPTAKGLAADAQLLDQDGTPDEEGQAAQLEQPVVSTQAEGPEREVSSSMSHLFLGPQTDADGNSVGDALGLIAETRQTIAPVTLFGGTEDAVTFEFLGEWVLRAVATGVPGTARVHYGPGEVSPETPILRVISGGEVSNILTFQDLLGEEGVTVDASPPVSVTLGEDPRAIGGDVDSEPQVAADGTSASGAVDVARITVLTEPDTGQAAEIRVGHMEVSADVHAGGITCDLPVVKSVDQPQVAPGDTFTYTITVTNTFRCRFDDVRIVDTVSASDGVTWTVTGTDPQAGSVSDTEIVWDGPGADRARRLPVGDRDRGRGRRLHSGHVPRRGDRHRDLRRRARHRAHRRRHRGRPDRRDRARRARGGAGSLRCRAGRRGRRRGAAATHGRRGARRARRAQPHRARGRTAPTVRRCRRGPAVATGGRTGDARPPYRRSPGGTGRRASPAGASSSSSTRTPWT